MTIQFSITIDTEEDQWDNYSSDVNTVKNISGLLDLQKLFDKYDAIPTYLINWPVATNTSSSQILKRLHNEHKCEIGTHCHPWNTPPFSEKINKTNSMMCNLPSKLIEQKMESLHEAIRKNLNLEPKSFRTGRWAFSSGIAKCIQKLGYNIDTSISPFIDWSEYQGPNFQGASTFPYRFEASDIFQKCENGPLLEIPASIGYLQDNFERSDKIRHLITSIGLRRLRILGLLDKLYLLNLRWLSPELSSSSDMVKLIKALVHNGNKVLNFNFHSTTLLPGKSPYVQSEEELISFKRKIEVVLKYCSEKNYTFSSLSNIQT